tara:strand:- start:457 stop:1443 length:987 start_codon:yes stop_codon:yes gene_type:complete
MRFLIIGSNSFSGSQFIKYLLNEGYEVLGVSRSNQIDSVYLPYTWSESNELFNFKQIDINKDIDKLISYVNEYKIEYIVNFAAQGMVAQSWKSPEDWYQTNVVGQVKLHNELRKLDFIKKYVHVTTPEVYGSTEGWIKENFNFSPSTPYAASRAACDLHLMTFFKAYKFPVLFTRAANVYGPGQQLYRIIPRAMLYARLGKKMDLHGGGHSIRSFINMDDVSDATLKIAQNGVKGESYHISTNETISIRNLVNKICNIAKINFDDLVNESDERLGKDQAYLLDSSKLRNDLNWKDLISIDDGLSETMKWVDYNLDILKRLPSNYEHKK